MINTQFCVIFSKNVMGEEYRPVRKLAKDQKT